MICERCRKKQVSVIHRQMRVGKLQIWHVCSSCSEILEATEELEDISAALPPYTASATEENGGSFPFFLPPMATEDHAAVCPLCGMTADELKTEGRAGCPRCYEVFAPVIRASAEVLHGRLCHAGQLPSAVRARKESEKQLATLREELRQAVASEAYERAAALRDNIRRLESAVGATEIRV